jgi:adenylylsulfate kinase-like enzyme
LRRTSDRSGRICVRRDANGLYRRARGALIEQKETLQ